MTDAPRTPLLTVLRTRWSVVARNSVLVAVLAAGLSLLLHNQYTAGTTLLKPDEQSDMMSLLSSVPGAMALSRLAGVEGGSATDLYLGVLKSDHVAQRLVQRFGLVKVYKVKDVEKAQKALAQNTSVQITNEGMVRVSVTDKNRELAANLANAYVEELDLFLRQNSNGSAGRRRAFLEKRVTETRGALSAVEDSLRSYQVTHRMPVMGTDVMRTAGAASSLVGKRTSLEVELGTLQSVTRQPSARAEELRNEIDQIDTQLMKIPQATTDMGRLFREVKTQESILLVLTEEFERAKLQEMRDTPSVNVLDRATPPLHKSKPARTLIVAACFVLALFANAGLVWVREPRVR